MANYVDQFEGYTVGGGVPTGLTRRWRTADTAWDIASDGTAGNIVKATVSAANKRLVLSVDAIDSDGTRSNCETLGRIRTSAWNATQAVTGHALRVSGAQSSETAYVAHLINGDFRVMKYVNGVFTSIAVASLTLSINTWYWVRVRVIDGTIKARIWADGGGEPGTWDIDSTDSSITAAGWIGMYAYVNGIQHDFGEIAIATNGDTATLGGEAAQLQTASAAISSGTGGLTTSITAQVQAVVSTTASGQILTAITLNANAQQLAAMTGDLLAVINLSGEVISAIAMQGAMADGAALAGSAGLASSATAELLTGIEISSAVGAVVSCDGDLSTAIDISASSAVVVSGSGVLTVNIEFSADVIATLNMGGELTAQIELSGAQIIEAISSGALTTRQAVTPGSRIIQLFGDKRTASISVDDRLLTVDAGTRILRAA